MLSFELVPKGVGVGGGPLPETLLVEKQVEATIWWCIAVILATEKAETGGF